MNELQKCTYHHIVTDRQSYRFARSTDTYIVSKRFFVYLFIIFYLSKIEITAVIRWINISKKQNFKHFILSQYFKLALLC